MATERQQKHWANLFFEWTEQIKESTTEEVLNKIYDQFDAVFSEAWFEENSFVEHVGVQFDRFNDAWGTQLRRVLSATEAFKEIFRDARPLL